MGDCSDGQYHSYPPSTSGQPAITLAAIGRLALVVIVASQSAIAAAAGYDCLVEPTQTVELASPVTGLIDKVLVKRGDRLARGQVVALLESRAEQAAADLAQFRSEQQGPTAAAESKLEFSRRKFDRRRQLAAEKLVPTQDSDDAEAEHKQAAAELLVAQENRQIARLEYQQQSSLLALRTIRSPVDGVVVDQLAYPGEAVEAGGGRKAIVKVAQLDPLRVHVILPKEIFGKIAAGQLADIAAEIPPDGRYRAKVRSVDRLIDAASGTFVALLEMPNPKLEIPAGVKCRASFAGIDHGTRPVPSNTRK